MNPIEIITNLGIVAPAPRGVHSPNTRYYRLNIVTNGIDASYICIRNTIEGTPLSDETHWMPLAKGALQLWSEQGGTGDLEDFLTWLKSPNSELVAQVDAIQVDVTQLKEKEAVVQAPFYLEFPNIGRADTLYVDKNSNLSYRWDDTGLKYYAINELTIDIINGGE